ncbi:MAG: hypothetical protein AOA66_1317 [Candidatus Bathyarchaeota archaeon BA2]|nr:MAG: hypothetical protein AOA66_1317 [Candidatus Bathyarchaeota archaeon BA2]
MPSLEEVKLKVGQVITEDWFTNLYEVLKETREQSAVTYEGHIRRDLLPEEDLKVILGDPTLRIKEVHVGTGYATYEFYVADKPVIKDGDPVTIIDEPHLLAKKIKYDAPDYIDVFSPDITMLYSGRARTKLLLAEDAYLYLKWIPKDETEILMDERRLDGRKFHEGDFTVEKDDKLNYRIRPTTTVSIFVYNIKTSGSLS